MKHRSKKLGAKVNTVLRTTDLNKFKFRKDNRVIREPHVKSLAKSMMKDGWLTGSYVVVNGDMELIDGQHRVKAAMLAGIPIQYLIEESATAMTIRKLQSNRKGWRIIDHIHGFVSENNQDYIELENFMKEYPDLRPTELMMLTQNSTSSIKREEFESGKFKVNNMSVARIWAEHIMSLKPYFEGYNKAIFVRALIRVLHKEPKFNFDSFLHKVKSRPMNIFMCGTVDQYVDMIEKCYNYNRVKKDRLNLRF